MNHTKKTLTLTIVIPVYNEQKVIAKCLDSIKDQSVVPDEVILVDNNCSDDSIKIAKKYDFVKIINETEQGIVYARNKGFNTAKSDIIARIDADVILGNDWVERVKRYFEEEDIGNSVLTGCGYFRNFHAFPRLLTYRIQDLMTFRFNKHILGHYALWGSNMAIRRADWLKVRNNVCQRSDIHEDLDLAIHAHRAKLRIHYKPDLVIDATMKRISFKKKPELYRNLLMWPRTVRVHDNKKWVFGWLGAEFLFVSGLVLTPINMMITRIRYGTWYH